MASLKSTTALSYSFFAPHTIPRLTRALSILGLDPDRLAIVGKRLVVLLLPVRCVATPDVRESALGSIRMASLQSANALSYCSCAAHITPRPT